MGGGGGFGGAHVVWGLHHGMVRGVRGGGGSACYHRAFTDAEGLVDGP